MDQLIVIRDSALEDYLVKYVTGFVLTFVTIQISKCMHHVLLYFHFASLHCCTWIKDTLILYNLSLISVKNVIEYI